jgi:Cdc6-like AAA superfamily ATPase
MRHAREVRDHRIAADILAQRQRQAEPAVLVMAGRQQLAQEHRLAPRIGQLDADHIAARHGGDARRHRAHRAGDVVG